MTKQLPFLILFFFGFQSCDDNNDCIEGSGIESTIATNVRLFEIVNNETTVDIILDNSISEDEILITGDDNLLELYDITEEFGVLEIKSNANCIQSTTPLFITLNPSTVSEFANSSTGDIKGEHVKEFLNINNSGTGDITLSGNFASLTLNNSGTGEVDLESAPVGAANVVSSGTGDIFLTVVQSLDVSISGTGDVLFKGDPVITSTISGTGELIDNN